MTLRTIDTLSTHYLDDYKTYPCEQKVETDSAWVGIKVEPKMDIILDIKWWHEDIKSDTAEALSLLSDKFIGSSYSESILNEFEKTCSRA